jgi:hypothetical protein
MLNYPEVPKGIECSPTNQRAPKAGDNMAGVKISTSRRPSGPNKANSDSKSRKMGHTRRRSTMRFSERKSIEQLAAEQGVRPTKLEDILGKGADLWESDQEFEKFVADIYARRREDRERAKQ